MEKWLIDARQRAKDEAEYVACEMRDIADTLQVDHIWFMEEVIKHLHRLKDGEQQ